MTTFVPEIRPLVSADDARNRVWIFGTPVTHTVAPTVFDIIFADLGLPRYKYGASDCKNLSDPNNSWQYEMEQPYALGSCLTMPLKVAVMDHLTEITPQAKILGSVNTTYWRKSPTGDLIQVGTNLDTAGVANMLLGSLTGFPTPFPPGTPLKFAPGVAAALMIGGGGATRAAIYALHSIGFSPIFLVNRDEEETAAIVAQFSEYDLRALTSVEQAKEALVKLNKAGTSLAASVGAIPSIEPVTDAEKLVYEISKTVFAHPYDPSISAVAPSHFLPLPQKAVHVEMAYKPPMTLIRRIAEDRNWATVCGMEIVAEVCFEQAYAWTGQIVPLETREKVREALRERNKQ